MSGNYIINCDGCSRTDKQQGVYEINKLFGDHLVGITKKINRPIVFTLSDVDGSHANVISINSSGVSEFSQYLRAMADFLDERVQKEREHGLVISSRRR